MAWDSSRPVPWRRLLTYLAIYAAVMVVITLLMSGDRLAEAAPGLVIGLVLATGLMVVMTKFGWTLPMLRSREEVASIRADKAAARSRSSNEHAAAGVEGPRERPPATKRTSTGHSQHPRRTTKSRKR